MDAVDLLFVAVTAGRHAGDVAVAGLEEYGFQLAVAVEVAEAHSSIAETGCIDLVGKTKGTSHSSLCWDACGIRRHCLLRTVAIRRNRGRCRLAMS